MVPTTGWLRRAAGVGLAIAAVTAAGLAAWSAPGRSATKPSESPSSGLRPATKAGYDVTLVTGDRVHVAPVAGGRSAVTVTPARGPRPRYWVTQRGDDLYVLPGDVAPLVPRRLDPELFNVTELAEQGYGADSTLPLIVAYGNGAADAPPGTTAVRDLESIRAVAVRAPASRADRLGRAIEQLADTGRQVQPSDGPLDRVAKIWLDQRVEVELSDSVPQIGAPEAWQAGYDGSGVTVAVLDTGVDAGHPDLADAVTASRNFTWDPDASDGHGHGTHVASTIASRGQDLRGVAPGAELISGKVLDAFGFGTASGLIDGMEWAAAEQDADIVNMSLGLPFDDFGAGPVAEAVDRLTAEHGALFVVAAGNGGCDGCVGSPGIAERALTVGAVDDDDVLADFSSRGPAAESFAIKPDVTAPGVGIVAARAAGTSLGDPVDEYHTALSGTSMAAPHVAGAAALLLDADSAASADALKAALMSTASPSADVSVYAQGAGRIDVARAFRTPVVAETGSLSFGHFRWPHAGRAPHTRSVTYRNRGADPVTLQLDVAVRDEEGQPAPDGTVSVGAPSVTVAPGGVAEVQVTLDSAQSEPGLYGGYLLARTPAGETLRTPIGFDLEQEMHELRVTGIARDGRPAWGGFNVLDVEDGARVSAQRFLPGEPGPCSAKPWDRAACVRVPPGTYSVMGVLFTMPAHAPSTEWQRTVLHTSLVGSPEVTVTEDTHLVLDARDAEEVVVETPKRDARANLGGALELVYHRAPESGPAVTQSILQGPGLQLEERFFLQPTASVARGGFAAYTRWQLEAPAISMDVAGRPEVALDPYYYDPVWHSDRSSQYPRLDGVRRLEVIDAGSATAEETAGLDLAGKLALVRRSDAISVPDQSANAADAGAAIVAVYNDRPGSNAEPGAINVRLRVPTVRLSFEEGSALLRRLEGRPGLSVRAEGVVASRYRYDLVLVENDRIPNDLHHSVRSDELARIDMRYHGHPDARMTYSEASYAFQPWEEFALSVIHPLQGAPRVRQEYFTTSPGTRWTHGVSTPESPYNYIWPQPPEAEIWLNRPGLSAYRPGERREVSWFEGPVAPGLNPQRPLQRRGDLLRVAMAGFVDSAGNHSPAYTSLFENGFATDFRMYEDGELIAQTNFLPVGTVPVSQGPAAYRIEYEVRNDAPWARLSTDTRTAWSFSSERPTGDAVVTPSLLTVDWDVDLDLRNRLERSGTHELQVEIGHQPDAAKVPVTSLAVDVSYDDGATWRAVSDVRRRDDRRWVADLQPSRAGSGFVSLRMQAEAANGGRVDQRIIRAYALSSASP